MASTHDISIAHTVSLIHDGFDDATPTAPPVLLVFINGLMLPCALWQPTIYILPPLLADIQARIYTLTYDRYGQGESRRPPPWKPLLHDLTSAATELETLLTHTLGTHPSLSTTHTPKFIFISHSIGVPLTRLQNAATTHPASAHLFLDSNISNTDFISLLPDPSSPTFAPSSLPPPTTVADLESLRTRTLTTFHPSVPNAEGLDRSTIATLMPHSDKPALRGPVLAPHPAAGTITITDHNTISSSSSNSNSNINSAPWLTVLGHDPTAFAEEGLRLQGTPVALNEKYIQPAWDKYNAGLLRLSEEGKVRGVVIAEGAGHFIQRDNPTCVAEEIVGLVRKVVGGT